MQGEGETQPRSYRIYLSDDTEAYAFHGADINALKEYKKRILAY